MKSVRLIIFITPFFLLWSCVNEDVVKNNIRIKASAHLSRTTYNSSNGMTDVSWEKGDVITLCTLEQIQEYYAINSGVETEFQAVNKKIQLHDGDSVFAYYPNHSNINNTNSTLSTRKVLLPSIMNQWYTSGLSVYDFMHTSGCVKNKELNLQFEHVFAFMKVKISVDVLQKLGANENGHYLFTLRSTNMIACSNAMFSLDKKKIEGDFFDHVIYIIDEKLDTEKLVTCYIAMLPQPDEAYVQFFVGSTLLYENRTPHGGFKAGHVYILDLDNMTEGSIEIFEEEQEEW